MPTLYTLQMSNSPSGFGKPCVGAIRVPGTTGNLCPELNDIIQPDPEAVKAALPYRYRKAFARSPNLWYSSGPNLFAPCYLTLKDRKGKYLNTIYAIPYSFNP